MESASGQMWPISYVGRGSGSSPARAARAMSVSVAAIATTTQTNDRMSSRLVCDRVRAATRIGAGPARAIVGDAYRADGASAPLPLRPLADLVTPRGERVAGIFADPPLDLELAGRVRVRPERVGERARRHARRFDRLLQRHVEHDVVEQHLEHRLLLHVATRRTERHHELAVAQQHGWCGREPRALARRHDALVRRIEPALRAAARDHAADTADGR